MYGSTSPDTPGASRQHSNRQISDNLLESVPSAAELYRDQRVRNLRFLWSALLSALLVGGAFIFMGLDSAALPLVLMAVVATPILLWRFRNLPLYTILISACLFEIFPSNRSDELTGRVPFFWNVNTIFQSHGASMEAVPLNLFEVVLVTAGVCSLFQAVFGRRVSLKGGALLLPMLAYLGFVVVGILRGLADGSDYHIIMQEVRAQFYLVITYVLALNLIQERREVDRIFWISAACIGLKGILYTYRRYVTMAGMELPDQGVGSHEEAFFFNCYAMLLLTLWLCNTQKKLQGWMLLLLPAVILGNLATNRRAGTAAVIISIPVLILAAYRGLPHRRSIAVVLGLVVGIGGPIYYNLFKNSNSAYAQPARALKSHFQPDERDAGSNAYRDAENGNQMATIKESVPTTLIGYGYGKPFLKVLPMVNIGNLYDKWDVLPHNQILWIWMRTGTLGFLAFWSIVCVALVRLCRLLMRPASETSVTHKVMGIWGLAVLVMLVVFGLLDLQLSVYRNMIFVGILLGIAESMQTLVEKTQARADLQKT